MMQPSLPLTPPPAPLLPPTTQHCQLIHVADSWPLVTVVCHLMPPIFSISCCRHCFVHGGLRFSVTTTAATQLDSVTQVAALAIAYCRRGATVIANHRRQLPTLLLSPVFRSCFDHHHSSPLRLLPMKREFEPCCGC
ncbi:unnamed protein product [Lactuca saligna]|uniref:Uncharacterized protein n=1 Tax=Lactuca saligna TaxID=75948 RepID=A0AA36EKD0_LACSI|nr:unnamed protein product [Lactuca saligna]